MIYQVISGKILRDAYMSAAVVIGDRKQDVDELNVYPVPDGDTGTNMSMTMGNAYKMLETMPTNNLTAEVVADTAASALLRGARGNSGVILSLLFRGFARGLKGADEVGTKEIVKALELGVDAAYKAVMKPTEGTILTVARMACEKAKELYNTVTDPVEMWEAVCEEADNALAQTPDMLPVLKKAGVVDAGGQGLVIVFTEMLAVFKGGSVKKKSANITVHTPANKTAVADMDTEITFTYCTEFIVKKKEGCREALALRAYLESIGDCVVVVDDDDIIKIHVHTDHPGKAFEEGLTYGMLVNMKIENMREQHEGRVKEAQIIKEREITPVKPTKKYGFVTVAAGAGIEAMFKDLGADVVVQGGQTMNPSTDDILNAIYSTPAEIVFVLPNNKNIIMAAEQAAELADREVCVIQARTIPQGITAMINFDETLDFNENRVAMTKALSKVGTGMVTFAARDSEVDGHNIKKGEILALENGKLAFTDKDVYKATYKLIKRLQKSDSQFLTVMYGTDVSEEHIEEFETYLNNKLGDKLEINMINGGQPVYYFIVSVE